VEEVVPQAVGLKGGGRYSTSDREENISKKSIAWTSDGRISRRGDTTSDPEGAANVNREGGGGGSIKERKEGACP